MGLSEWSGVQLLSSCFLLWIVPYAAFLTAVEATSYFVLSVLVGGPFLTYLFISYYSIPQPPDSVVGEILGDQLDRRTPRYMSCAGGKPCSDEKQSIIKNANRIIAIAHRFAGFDAPENTTTALNLCIKNGAKAVEFDVMLTADMVPVVFHDAKLERLTGLAEDITSMPYSTLKEVNISKNHHFREQFPNTTIPMLDDVIKICIEKDVRMILDIKEERLEIVDIIIDLYRKHPAMYKRAIISSFNPWIIYNIRKIDPDIVGGLTWRPAYISFKDSTQFDKDSQGNFIMHYLSRLADIAHSFFFFNFASNLLGISIVLIYKDNITIDMIYYWDNHKVRTIAWTVNSPVEKQYMVKELGISYVTDTMLGNTTDQ